MRGSKCRILEHFATHNPKTISSMEAFELYGITRLSARIKDLRDLGYEIDTIMVDSVNRYGEPVRYANYLFKSRGNN